MKGARRLGLLGLLAATAVLAFAAMASAKEVRFALGPLGSFTEPRGLAVDQGSGDVYAIDGRSEVQRVTISATAGQFRLKLGGKETGDLPFDVKETPLQEAMRSAFCAGAPCVNVSSNTGSQPFLIRFQFALGTTDVAPLECVAGTVPLSGGSGCSVTTTTPGVNGTITRYKADGTPADFSALGSNAIDGIGPGPDETPQKGLHFIDPPATQVAVDESGGSTDGDIYVTQIGDHLVDIFAPSGEFKGQISEYEEGGAKALENVCGVTVDPSGNVYVADFSTGIHKYDPAGNNIANFSTVPLPCTLAAGAGPTSGFLFANRLFGPLFKLDANSGEVKYEVSKENTTVTVNPVSGQVLTATRSEVREFAASGASSATQTGSTAAASPVSGVAVDATSGNLYLSREGAQSLDVFGPVVTVPDVKTEAATELTANSATLNATIAAANVPGASCHFQYTTEAAYLADKAIVGHDGFSGAQSAPCEPAGPFSGFAVNAVSAEVSPLSPETKYEFRIVGENANGESPGEAEPFETRGKPAIKGGIASEVTTTTAKISGEVNPRGLASTFAVQYVTQVDFEASGYAGATTTPEESAGSGAGFAAVSQALSGLEPGTAYHFRLIAKNEAGTATPGEDHTFTTFTVPSGLPEGRAWEQVSPAVKLGEVFPPFSGARVNLGGTCKQCTPGFAKGPMPMQVSPDGNSIAYEGNPFSAGLASGANEYIAGRGTGGWATTPLSGPEYEEAVNGGVGFKAFSADLSRGVLYQWNPTLSPDAPPGYPNLYLWQAGGALTPLITSEPPNRSPGSPYGANAFRPTYAGANAGTDSTPAFSHLVFQANDALSGEVPGIAPEAPLVTKVETETNLYEWSDGQLHLVNVLPGNNAAAPDAVIGSGEMLSPGAGDTFAFDHAISDDGNRVFWSAQPSGQVYVREGATSTTKVPDPGKFITATPDGAKVLLSNGHVFNLEDESTADLTEGEGGFQGTLGTSEDFSRVYFVDTKALTAPTEENANGEAAEEGEFNLYLAEGGTTTFIGILLSGSEVNDNSASNGAWRASSGSRTAQVSADGRYLAFTSRAVLTGYGNVSLKEGCSGLLTNIEGPRACPEVFEYDAVQGSLHCASCNPTGEAPLGGSNLALFNVTSTNPFPQPHNLPDEGQGRLFFESRDDLSAADTNGVIQDIYEWQPQGIGGCARPDGCISLISGGHSPADSRFVDASPSGKDVFFTTWDQLVPFDKDDLMDLYDVRVGGGFEYSAQEPCLGEACLGAASAAPEPQSPGTAGFSEAVPKPKAACRKGAVKKRGRCVAKKKKRHHHKRAAKHNRGGAK